VSLSDQPKCCQRDAFQGATAFASNAKQSSGATVIDVALPWVASLCSRERTAGVQHATPRSREAAVNGRSLDRI
jgi:hypothetical protein